jgi:hypothetical protein
MDWGNKLKGIAALKQNYIKALWYLMKGRYRDRFQRSNFYSLWNLLRVVWKFDNQSLCVTIVTLPDENNEDIWVSFKP